MIGSRVDASSSAWEPERSKLITTTRACPSIALRVRIRRLEESVSIIKQFFTQDSVTFAGEYYTVTDLPAFPKAGPASASAYLHRRVAARRLLRWRRARPTSPAWKHRVKDGADTFAAFEHSEAALAQKVEFLREAAGERFAAIELNHGIRKIIITEDRQQAAEQRARERAATGVTPNRSWTTPICLLARWSYMVETLQRRREQFGISYLHVPFQDLELFAPVVARLAGR